MGQGEEMQNGDDYHGADYVNDRGDHDDGGRFHHHHYESFFLDEQHISWRDDFDAAVRYDNDPPGAVVYHHHAGEHFDNDPCVADDCEYRVHDDQ